MTVPQPQVITHALGAEPAILCCEAGGYFTYYASYGQGLDGMTIHAYHHRDSLTEEPDAVVMVTFVTATATLVFLFACHLLLLFNKP